MDPQVVLNKVMRLARFDTTVFDEVRNDQQQTIPALIVAAVAILLFGFGGFLLAVFRNTPFLDKGDIFVKSFIVGSILAMALWFVWVLIAYALLTSLYKTAGTFDVQVFVRVMGYAAAPFAIGLLFLLPMLGFIFGLLALILVFMMSVHAVQSVTNAPLANSVMANAAGFLVFALVLSFIAANSALTDTPIVPNFFLWNVLG